MPIEPGGHIGGYRIEAPLGQGGMGTVYRGFDTTLQRPVAIKVLSGEDARASQTKLLAEARATSALSHPNVATVHEVGEHDGQPYIVMELVEGKPLSELIPSDGLPPETVIRYGLQIADALAHAHEKGVIHRDLKSQNVVITPEGRAKVLDFGLAMRLERQDAEAVTVSLDTQVGPAKMAGTLAYMAPEVLRGEDATARSDIWALGVLLYEMASGRLPFSGKTRTDVVSAIVKETPASLPVAVSAGVRNIIQHCLTKEPQRRYSTAGAAQAALDAIQSDSAEAHVLPAVAPSRTPTLWVVAGVVVLVALAAVATSWLRPSGEAIATSASVPHLTNPRQLTRAVGVEDFPVISPDGTMLAYHSVEYDTDFYAAGQGDIWITRIGEGQPVNRTDEQPGSNLMPSWSPDGEQIAFTSDRAGTRQVFVMPVLAGPARQVSALRPSGASRPVWSPDGGEVAFTTVDEDERSIIAIASLATGTVEQIELQNTTGTQPGGFSNLSWSPNGRLFAYNEGYDGNQVRVLWIVRRVDGVGFRITDNEQDDSGPSWSLDSRTLYFVSNRGGGRDLWQQQLDEDGEPVGSPEAVTVGIGMRHAAMSPDGRTLTYSRGGGTSHIWRVPILPDRRATWADAEQITFDEAFIEFFDVSPDGERLAIDSTRTGNPDIWVFPISGGEMQQITSDIAPDWSPRWSPDGERIAFYSVRTGNRDIWVAPVGGGPALQLTNSTETDWQPIWSPDGSEIAFGKGAGIDEIWSVPAAGGDPRLITTHSRGAREWSRDGEQILTSRSIVDVTTGTTEPHSTVLSAARYAEDETRVFYIRGLDLWLYSLQDGAERPVTDLGDPTRRGGIVRGSIAVTAEYLYFNWGEYNGDIWVMDVVQDEP